MSIKVMTLVWAGYPQGGSFKLVMLALADWCGDDGSNLFPSNEAVAKKCCISRSQTIRILRDLTCQGYLQVVGNSSGGAPGTTKQYQMILERLTGSVDATGSASATGSVDASRRVAPMRQTGSMGATLTVSKPLVEPLVMPPPAAAIPIRPLTSKGTRLSEDWELDEDMGKWAEAKRRLSPAQVMDMADRFKDHWLAQSGSRGVKLDWAATWRNWVRNDWQVDKQQRR